MSQTTHEPRRLAPATIDWIILNKLREKGRAVDVLELLDLCKIRYQTSPDERADSLRRLVARGDIRMIKERVRSRKMPLMEWTDVTLYEAIGGQDGR